MANGNLRLVIDREGLWRDEVQALSEEWYWRVDGGLRFLQLSDNALRTAGFEPARWLGRGFHDVFTAVADEPCFSAAETFRGSIHTYVDGDNHRRLVSLSGQPMLDREGRIAGWQGIGRDVGWVRGSERNILEVQELLLYGLETIAEGFAVYDPDDRLVLANKNYDFFSDGQAPLMRQGQHFDDIVERGVRHGLYPAAVGREKEWIAERIEYHRNPNGVFQVELCDGRWIQYITRRIKGGGTVIIHTDITANKHRDEKQLQAQKLQSLGQLTGGVAHDFGNILFLLECNLDLILQASARGRSVASHVDASRAAFSLANDLIGQLLAVARQQPLQPRVVEANDVVAHVCTLIGRTLSRNIRVETALDARSSRVLVDPSQLETAILNLCLNARDAMPEGGILRLTTGTAVIDHGVAGQQPELQHGVYAAISVSDTGCGMSREIANRAMEPFFTTKAASKGSGLGLSMAYGFIKQSGGELGIASALGGGTTVRILLPRVEGAAVADAAPLEPILE